ncbi:hypothetical protein GW17_00004821 [Ensete ventricosum]|nr:hypothetical protein GW17_00004821 [Ensete ventricosum]
MVGRVLTIGDEAFTSLGVIVGWRILSISTSNCNVPIPSNLVISLGEISTFKPHVPQAVLHPFDCDRGDVDAGDVGNAILAQLLAEPRVPAPNLQYLPTFKGNGKKRITLDACMILSTGREETRNYRVGWVEEGAEKVLEVGVIFEPLVVLLGGEPLIPCSNNNDGKSYERRDGKTESGIELANGPVVRIEIGGRRARGDVPGADALCLRYHVGHQTLRALTMPYPNHMAAFDKK